MLAMRFNWTKTMVDEQDPHYIDELVIALTAETDHHRDEAKKHAKQNNS